MKRTPIDTDCPACAGHGRVRPAWTLCPTCDGLGRVYVPCAPSFGCSLTLKGRKVGELVTLGNGDAGRVVRHLGIGARPLTFVRLVDPIADLEDATPTPYPTCTGVVSVRPVDWNTAQAARPSSGRDRGDALDPLRIPS